MLPFPFENALVLTGPTGSGKTQLGIELARRMDAEIISMDSMAVYRRMNVGTAKPTLEQRAIVPHHLVDVLEPWESANVAWWLDHAKVCATEIESRGKQVLFVGGTPLYLKALICGLFEGPPADATIRTRLTEEASTAGSDSLHGRLAAIDPISATRIHPNDVRRIIRALEVHELTGKPIGEWQTQWAVGSQQSAVGSRQSILPTADCPLPTGPADCPLPTVLWLELPRELLYERINRRVVEMFAGGLLDEGRQLRSGERPLGLEASKALGYKEIFEVLDGTITQEEAIVRVQTRSRNFAKRQLAWFRHLPECRPITMELTWTLWQSRIR
ncbi:MAG: tRNA (adenosine(37)-N6)-dimethylallyltransferase MiaA [Planctomycetes bacterium]|nr:tRNA (adenosine(37)-N6)-dimethylallyltransferase MiaA [Planctomycetota bacterium]